MRSTGSPSTHDDDAVHLDAVHELLEDRHSRRRLRDGRAEIALELLSALDPEHGALTARVRGLEHRGKRHGVERGVHVARRANGCERRLRHTSARERVAHLELVRHPLRRLDADSGQPERLGDGCHDRNSAVRCHGEHAVDSVFPPRFDDSLHVREVDELADVGGPEPERLRVAVDGDDAVAELLHALDRAALMAAAAHEQEGLHRVPSALPHVASDPPRR